MHCNILSLFPEYFHSPLGTGLMEKAREKGIVSVDLVNPRDYTLDRHNRVDGRPYGGGPGMVMAVEPVHRALQSISPPGRKLILSARGRPLDQEMVRELSGEEILTLICGRYEEIDARLLEIEDIEPISIGDFVLGGGEAAALCLLESVSRLQPRFMGRQESADEESFNQGLLEYPHYTRPREYKGVRVPDILVSGDHGSVDQWRRQQSLLTTLRLRPELLQQSRLEPADYTWLRGVPWNRPGRNLYPVLLHHPVVNKHGQTCTVSLTNLDIHDIARVCRTYGLPRYYLVTPLRDQQELAARLLRHWAEDGPGGEANTTRARAIEQVRVHSDLEQALEDVRQRCGQEPFLAATSARDEGSATPGDIRSILRERPVMLILGTGHGLAREVLERADALLRPIRPFGEYRHLSVRSAAAITIDRILGDVW
ncbi:MAG: tRNA (guanosine(37)-N1)-methyltransferase TrmD [Desulfohalobiaceae bacterium]|nr:tRNA (guanosine(37)-N1)-methyltransferase TrmD [Desulfohalobiaceae bacterium]